jgi:ATP-binding cassette subfamily F protein uup
MTILANLQNISLAFGQKILFENGNLTLNSSDKVGLIGLNGHGKSTLLKIIMEQMKPDTCKPPFVYDKNNDLDILYIPQDIEVEKYPELNIKNFYLAFYPGVYETFKKLWKIEEELSQNIDLDKNIKRQEVLLEELNSKGVWQIEQVYESYIKKFGLLDREDITILSGGEKRKIALAAGLSTNATLVLWDEPTNHLDIETIEYFEDEMMNIQTAFVMVSHDRYLLGNICNKIIHIDRGEIIPFAGNYLQYMEFLVEKEKERLKSLDRATNQHRRELAWMRQGIKARGTRSKKRVEGYENLKSDISRLKSMAKKEVTLDLAHSGRKTKQLIEIKEASFAYADKKIIDNLTVSIFKNDKIALIGKNGQGKTTLINLLKDELEFTSGKIKRADTLDIKVFSQNRDSLPLDKTPFEIIGDGQDFVHLPDGRNQHVNAYLENFLFLSTEIRRPINTLSGGEKNRLQLALFMKEVADVWVFDEPTNDLDIETIEILESRLRDYKGAVIIISHDRAFLDNIVKSTWVLHNRKLEVFQGGYTQVAPYLHAIEMEAELGDTVEEIPQEVSKVENEAPKAKMNNKEKMRFKVIEKEISDAETNLESFETQLASFDFSTMDDNKTKEYQSLQEEQKKWETTLESLYEEWEDLGSKQA